MTDDPKPLPRVPKPQLEMTIPAKTVAEALEFWMNQTQRNPARPVTVHTGHLRMDGQTKALTFLFEEDHSAPIPFPGNRVVTNASTQWREPKYCDHGISLTGHCDQCAPPPGAAA